MITGKPAFYLAYLFLENKCHEIDFSLFKDAHILSPTDGLRKIRSHYYPGRDLSLNEAMVLWRGRLLFKQFIKNKRHKYGIKL